MQGRTFNAGPYGQCKAQEEHAVPSTVPASSGVFGDPCLMGPQMVPSTRLMRPQSDAGVWCWSRRGAMFSIWGRQVGGRQHRWSFSRVGRSPSFGLLDEVCLKDEFNCRAHVVRVVLFVVTKAFRGAMRLVFEEILEGHEVNSNTRMSRGWKLLMLLPRMLLHRPSRGGRISRKQLEERFRRFQEGEWLCLLREGQGCCSEAHRRSVREEERG